MFSYKVVFRMLSTALAHIFHLHPDCSNVRLWRDNVVPLPIVDNVIYVDFKAKKRIA